MRQPGYIETLNPETASLLAAKLKAAEPQFGPVTNSIDMIDVFRYVDWMSARYALEQKSAQTASSPEDFYARIAIDAGKTDARVLVAILASEVGDQTVAGLKRTGALPAAEQVLLQYAAGTNLNVSTKELVATGQSRINAQRGAP